MLHPILLLLGLVSLVLYIREKIRSYSIKALLLKSLVSTLFVAVGVYGFWLAAARGAVSLLCPFVVMGLVFGLMGDVWLDLKYVFPAEAESFTYAGFTVFGIGHVAYLLGMILAFAPKEQPMVVVLPLLLGLVFSFCNLKLEKKMKLNYGKLRPVVFLYGVLLFSTVLLAGSVALANSWQVTALNVFFVGSVLFALSDLILSGTYFGEGKGRPIDLALNYITYYGGQFLIASSLVFLV